MNEEKNQVILEGRLNGHMPSVFYAKDQLRVQFEVKHTNPQSGNTHRFIAEIRGNETAKDIFNEYGPGRMIGITGRMKIASLGRTKIIVDNYTMLDKLEYVFESDYAEEKANVLEQVKARYEASKTIALDAPIEDEDAEGADESAETDE